MRKTVIIALAILSVLSCTKTDNCENSDPGTLFNRHLSVVKKMDKHQALGSAEYFSIFFLEEVSGINSAVNYGDVSVYQKDRLRHSDIKKWKKWFKKNGCMLNYESLLLIESKLKEDNPWIRLEDT